MSIHIYYKDPIQRLTDSTEFTDTCWIWLGNLSASGYSLIKVDGKQTKAHRYFYELFIDNIADGLTIDHLCRNKRCVNPEHLEPVSNRENIKRGIDARYGKYCARGHKRDGNTVEYGSGGRTCLLCKSLLAKESYLRRKQHA